tara:strand:+ start:694 stop:1764 length:1071 start_codon:yes stop_codon:yes gene_type:complete
VSIAGGGTSKVTVGKYYHLKQFADELEKLGVNCKLIRETDYVVGFPTKRIHKMILNNIKFKKLINDFKPDVVFTDGKTTFGKQVLKLNIPLFVLLRGHHWSQIEYAKETIYKSFFMKKILDMRDKIANEVMANATMLMPICNYLIPIIKEHHPKQSSGVFVEGVDDSIWYKTKGMNLNHPCVGLLQDANWWRKTKEMLVLENVLREMPDVSFYWAGDGQYKDEILKVLGKFKNFHWLGPLEYPDKVREFLSDIDVYALITGMDLAPLSLKEAQLMEKPVISTDVGGNSEMMDDNVTGFLVKEGESKEIIEKISLLIRDKQLSVDMGKKGRRFIQENYSLKRSAENFLEIIRPYVNK